MPADDFEELVRRTFGRYDPRALAIAVGAVLGDSEYLLHSEFFDHGFATDPEGMLQRVADFVDPATWPPDLQDIYQRVRSAAAPGAAG